MNEINDKSLMVRLVTSWATDEVMVSEFIKKLDCTLNVYFDSKMYLIRC